MLHPTQFQVNEAWIAFQFNAEPIHTEQDGDFNFFALMDAASCFILGSEPVAADVSEPNQMTSQRLLQHGKIRGKRWPKTLFVPSDRPQTALAREAMRHGIAVVRVPEDQLHVFISEAKDGFSERFG